MKDQEKKTPTLISSIENIFEIQEDEGPNKVISLEQAIRQNVQPGMSIFLGYDASAASCEILRQFWDTTPGFTLIMSVVTEHALSLVHAGLVKKLIASICTHSYPTPGPSKVVQRAFKNKTIDIEFWSLYSLQQRLMAGAQGIPFTPTKSLIGSSMAKENKDSFIIIDDPFGSGERIGLAKALNPDIAIIHALASDGYGNTLPSPVSQDTHWGPKASKKTLVTVEHIVATSYIRKHSSLVRFPGYMVHAVSQAQLGAHPQCLANGILAGIESYAEDREFMVDYREASQSPDRLTSWIQEWIIDCRDHSAYVNKLGTERIQSLKEGALEDNWRSELSYARATISPSCKYNLMEMMIIGAARKIRQRVIESNHATMLAGVGASSLAAWLAFYNLRQYDRYPIELIVGSGLFGNTPRPGNPFPLKLSDVWSCKMLGDVSEMYGVHVGGQNARCVSVLSAAQVDRCGNLNAAKLSNDTLLVGPGGSNDNTSGASEVIVVMPQIRERFLDQLPYISCRGDRVSTLISTMGILEKDHSQEFMLTKCMPSSKSMSIKKRIETTKDNCGWELKVANRVDDILPPTVEELTTLRLLDPTGFFIGESG
ncbi:MAG: CoA-transferase [Chloroflexota bacterium]|nr:CoA-transferase [Chloroflexota bacterium]